MNSLPSCFEHVYKGAIKSDVLLFFREDFYPFKIPVYFWRRYLITVNQSTLYITKDKKIGEWIESNNRWEQKTCTMAYDEKIFHREKYFCLCHFAKC